MEEYLKTYQRIKENIEPIYKKGSAPTTFLTIRIHNIF
jgi:hypothetical protein